MMQRTKVLHRLPRPTKMAFRAAVAEIIRHLKAAHSLTNDELADRLGCSGPTIGNAENMRNDLSALILANIQHEFGPDAIDRFQALSGSRGIPENETCASDLNTICSLAKAITKLSEIQCPHSEDGPATGANEARTTLPILRAARATLDHEIARMAPKVAA